MVRTSRPIRLLVSVLLSGLSVVGLPAGQRVSAAPGDQFPDLVIAYPTELRIEVGASGARRIRFTTLIVNIGAGPFETGSSRLPGESVMGVNQRIYNADGTIRKVSTKATARYAGDGHDHWHVQDVAHYELYAIARPDIALRRDSKVGFCFFDTNAYQLTLPRAPRTRQYSAAGCGKRSSLFVKNGISVGWADKYGAKLALQWIGITDLPAGQYFLKVTVDPLRRFKEVRRGNNCKWLRIRIPTTGSAVAVLDRGTSCLLPGASPTGDTIPAAAPSAT
jgi:lysyl oxidase